MRAAEIGSLTCSVARAAAIVGDAWTLLLLRELFLGGRRFEDFQSATGMAPALLSARLSRLVGEGIIARRPYRQRPVRHEYRLTEKGLDLYPVIIGLMEWGDRWAKPDGEPPPVTLTHKTCGRTTHHRLVCSECGEPLDPHDVRAVLGPEFQAERTAMGVAERKGRT